MPSCWICWLLASARAKSSSGRNSARDGWMNRGADPLPPKAAAANHRPSKAATYHRPEWKVQRAVLEDVPSKLHRHAPYDYEIRATLVCHLGHFASVFACVRSSHAVICACPAYVPHLQPRNCLGETTSPHAAGPVCLSITKRSATSPVIFHSQHSHGGQR